MAVTSQKDKTLVTGAGGFIGSHLVERLVRDGAAVRALVHYNSRNDWGLLESLPGDLLAHVEVLSGDIQDPFFVDKTVKGCSTVYHLASLIAIPFSYVAPHSFVATNIGGAINVLQASLKHGIQRVVHTSTSECYGTAEYVPIDEKHPLKAQSPYAASKISADMIAESYWRSFGLPVAIIRPFNTYGPRQSARAVIPTIITQTLAAKSIHLGSLNPTRDLNYVADTVEGFIRVGQSPEAIGEIINIGSGKEISIGELAKRVLKIMGRDALIKTDEERVRPQTSEVERLLCNNGKARALLAWEPRVRLDQGLAQTIEWVSTNIERYKSDLYNI
jgi:NAD dependent epimerase/dehydratase